MDNYKTYKQEQEQLQQEAPTLFAMSKQLVFAVPEMYFDLLREEWALRSASTLNKGESTSSFQTPKGYFESASTELFSSISSSPEQILEETSEDSSLNVPEGYFGQLSADIFAQTSRAPEKKEAPIRRLFSTKRVYWIAASAAVLIMAVTTFLAQSAEEECNTFACLLKNTQLSENELIDIYSEEHFEAEWAMEEVIEMDVVTNEELNQFLEEDLDWMIENELY